VAGFLEVLAGVRHGLAVDARRRPAEVVRHRPQRAWKPNQLQQSVKLLASRADKGDTALHFLPSRLTANNEPVEGLITAQSVNSALVHR
jgi:hypothetical protein